MSLDDFNMDKVIMLVVGPLLVPCTLKSDAILHTAAKEVTLPPEFADFSSVFSKEGATKYPAHTKVRYLIKIKPG